MKRNTAEIAVESYRRSDGKEMFRVLVDGAPVISSLPSKAAAFAKAHGLAMKHSARLKPNPIDTRTVEDTLHFYCTEAEHPTADEIGRSIGKLVSKYSYGSIQDDEKMALLDWLMENGYPLGRYWQLLASFEADAVFIPNDIQHPDNDAVLDALKKSRWSRENRVVSITWKEDAHYTSSGWKKWIEYQIDYGRRPRLKFATLRPPKR